ncbi:hypothetical protein LBMAG27_10950 [Bacteroidota bacterium]|nr:hypothetical protein LBMAG27_10950 [Bacteroidota bacterium]
MDLKSINNSFVVDVRTTGEFSMGHVIGSINIPLNELADRMEELKAMNGKIILCCASGNRSGQAHRYLLQNGFTEIHNGGSWMDVEYEFFNQTNNNRA